MNTVNVPQSLLSHTISFVETAGITVKKAMDLVSVAEAQQKQAAAIRPEIMEKLAAAGLIDQETRAGTEAMLADHPGTLRLFKAAIDRLVEAEAKLSQKSGADLGRGVNDPQAPDQYSSLNGPYVGGAYTRHKKASDAAFAGEYTGGR